MATTRAQVAQLYTPIYDVFMLATFKEETQAHKEVFKEISDSTKEYKVDDVSGLGIWIEAEELASGNYEDPVLGYPKTYTQTKFIKKFQSSFEAIDQDEYALLKKEGEASAMGRGARARVETDTMITTIYGGFATACADGQYLWDTDHPKNREETSSTYSNLLSGAFSHDALETAETQICANHFDLKGLPIADAIEDAVILHPPALRGIMQRVLSERADERPGTTNRDINRFAGKYRTVESRYLASWNGGSNTCWFIIFPSLGFFKIIWSQKPHFTSWIDEENDSYKFKGRMLYAQGNDNWRGGFGSTGI